MKAFLITLIAPFVLGMELPYIGVDTMATVADVESPHAYTVDDENGGPTAEFVSSPKYSLWREEFTVAIRINTAGLDVSDIQTQYALVELKKGNEIGDKSFIATGILSPHVQQSGESQLITQRVKAPLDGNKDGKPDLADHLRLAIQLTCSINGRPFEAFLLTEKLPEYRAKKVYKFFRVLKKMMFWRSRSRIEEMPEEGRNRLADIKGEDIIQMDSATGAVPFVPVELRSHPISDDDDSYDDDSDEEPMDDSTAMQ